jgi:DNA-directed RNA polymerase sigma subunit (sigma70/sigma32)
MNQLDESKELRKILEENVSKLPYDQAKVVELRYGLLDGYALSVEKVAAMIGKSIEEVKELEANALRNMGWRG